MALRGTERIDYGFVRDGRRRLVVTTEGEGRMDQGFLKDEDGRLIVTGIAAAPPATFGGFRLALNESLAPGITHPDRYLICQWWQSKRMEEARALGSKILIYQNLTRAHAVPANGLYGSGLSLAEAEAIGAKSTTKDEDEGGYVCKPNVGGYPALWAEKAIARAREAGADGIFCDDLNTYADATTDLTEAEWLGQLEACNAVVGPAIKAAGLLGIPNMAGTIGQRNLEAEGWLEDQFQFYDGGLDEAFCTWGNGELQAQAYIESALGVIERQSALGKLCLVQTPGPAEGTGHVTFGIAAALVYGGDNVDFFTQNSQSYSDQDYPEALERALELGHPTSVAGSSPRIFEHGTASVDLSAHTGSIEVTS